MLEFAVDVLDFPGLQVPGAPISCLWGSCLFQFRECRFNLPADDVDDGEDDDPDGVDKVPVDGDDFQPLGMMLRELTGEREDESKTEHDQADDDVRGMQANERIKSGSE